MWEISPRSLLGGVRSLNVNQVYTQLFLCSVHVWAACVMRVNNACDSDGVCVWRVCMGVPD